ncbi:MAG: GNAT family N-acetyltransferase [Chloroflexi bacterium]|nr:GNAT family N-acetyltransferase [Chloroflexota bacterium]
MEYHHEVVAFLKSNALKHIVHLKMIDAYAEQMICHYAQHDAEQGVLMLLPTLANPFDAKTYPQSEFVVLIAASNQDCVQRLVTHIPRNQNLIFKLVDDMTRQVVINEFPSTRMTAFISYTTDTRRLRSHPQVIASQVLDQRTCACYRENGYTSEEMERFFEQGARSFTIFERDEPISTCFIFRNFENIWEIGGVYTVPSRRRQGFARPVVETALAHVLACGYAPRYQVRETNIASIRLAETLGLEKFVVTEHFVYTAIKVDASARLSDFPITKRASVN